MRGGICREVRGGICREVRRKVWILRKYHHDGELVPTLTDEEKDQRSENFLNILCGNCGELNTIYKFT